MKNKLLLILTLPGALCHGMKRSLPDILEDATRAITSNTTRDRRAELSAAELRAERIAAHLDSRRTAQHERVEEMRKLLAACSTEGVALPATTSTADEESNTVIALRAERRAAKIAAHLGLDAARSSAFDEIAGVAKRVEGTPTMTTTTETTASERAAKHRAAKMAGRSDLHRAARSGDIDAIERLLAQGADVNAVSDDHYTPLALAAKRGHLNAVRLLISKGATVNRRVTYDEYVYEPEALDWAVAKKNKDVAELLLQNGANPNFCSGGDAMSSLATAVHTGDPSLVALLLDYGADVNENQGGYGLTALHHAAQTGDLAVAQLLVARGAQLEIVDITEEQYTPLQAAIFEHEDALAQFLVNAGANPQRGLAQAIEFSNLKIIEFLVSKGANPQDGLAQAVEYDDSEIFEFLASKGANPRACNARGKTLLHHAAEHAAVKCAELLVNKRVIGVNTATRSGITPLDVALQCWRENSEIVQLLVANGGQKRISKPKNQGNL